MLLIDSILIVQILVFSMKAWAKFCYPEENWSCGDFQKKLYTSHKMLCSKHFPESAFVEDNMQTKKLHRYAIPSEVTATLQTSQIEIPKTLSVQNVTCLPGTSKSNVSGNVKRIF